MPIRSVIVVDRSFAMRERLLLSRLEIGLADEGVRVAHAVPSDMLKGEAGGLYSAAVGYVERGLPLTLTQRTHMLREQLDAAFDLDEGERIDVVHALGDGLEGSLGMAGGAWGVGFQLARSVGAGLIVEVWAGHQIAQAALLRTRALAAGVAVLFLTPDEAMQRALSIRLPGPSGHSVAGGGGAAALGAVRAAPWGVHLPDSPRRVRSTGWTPAVAILVDRADARSLQSIIDGVTRPRAPGPVAGPAGAPGGSGGSVPPLIFVGAEGVAADLVWQIARRLQVLPRVTIVSDMERCREPVLEMDALIVPGSTGIHRTIVLDAMGAGLPIIAGPDPMLGYLGDDTIVKRVLNAASPLEWSAAVWETLAGTEESTARVIRAREFVASERSASSYVRSVLTAYDLITSPTETARA